MKYDKHMITTATTTSASPDTFMMTVPKADVRFFKAMAKKIFSARKKS